MQVPSIYRLKRARMIMNSMMSPRVFASEAANYN
jgi:hypothetical protein